MARGFGGSLLVPLILAFVLGIVLYFYWGVSSQLGGLQVDNRGLKKELANARNERDNLHYRLNLLREDLNLALQKRDELEQHAESEEERRREAEDLVSHNEEKWKKSEQERQQMRLEIKDLEQHNGILDEDVEQFQKDLNACQDEKAQLKAVHQSTETLHEQNSLLQANLNKLQEDKKQMSNQVSELMNRVRNLEEQVRVCRGEGVRGGGVNQPRESLEDRMLRDLQGKRNSVDNAPTPDLIREA